jgi:pimeloyl-ACP methyl ester carboxylesterase
VTTTAASDTGTTIDAGGIETYYHDVGPRDGAPVLLLHGSGPGVSGWANWRLNMDALAAAGNRVLAPDLVGFGATERPPGVHYSLSTWAGQVFAFMDALEIRRTALVGNSLGGRISLEMAGRHPQRVERMVLMGAPGPGMTMTPGLKAVREYEPSEENMRQLLLECFAVDPSIITDDLVRNRYQASIANGAHETYVEMFTDKHNATALGISEDEVRSIRTRTLLVHGREDKVIPLEIALNMVRLLPDADLAVFARCGHWTQIERSTDFNNLVGHFLGAKE